MRAPVLKPARCSESVRGRLCRVHGRERRVCLQSRSSASSKVIEDHLPERFKAKRTQFFVIITEAYMMWISRSRCRVHRRERRRPGSPDAESATTERLGFCGPATLHWQPQSGARGAQPQDLARQSSLSVATIRRAELTDDETSMTAANDLAVRRALEAAGVEFIDENGGGPGVRLRKSGKERPHK